LVGAVIQIVVNVLALIRTTVQLALLLRCIMLLKAFVATLHVPIVMALEITNVQLVLHLDGTVLEMGDVATTLVQDVMDQIETIALLVRED
jgi:hypothetical protein